MYRKVEELLIRHKINMVSAQSTHRKVEGSTPTQWKQWCFDKILEAQETKPKWVLSIGDQWSDHVSVQQSIGVLKSCPPIHHVIKLKMAPTVEDMVAETMYIQSCFEQIFNIFTHRESPYYSAPHSVHPVIIDYEVCLQCYFRHETTSID